jgi:hypothetical protein
MNNLKSLFKKHLISIVGGSIVVLILVIGYLGCGPTEGERLQQTVTNQSNQVNEAVQEAANARDVAANASIERLTTDAVREKTITPKLGASRRKSQQSKADLRKARKTYNEKQNDTSLLSNSDSDNCRKLAELFPNVRFADCR